MAYNGRKNYKQTQKQAKKNAKKAAIKKNNYMTLPRFFLLQAAILCFTLALTYSIRGTTVRLTDYSDFIREDIQQEWGYPDYTYLNNYVTGGKISPSTLYPVELTGKHLQAPESKHLTIYTYDELFQEDPHEHAVIYALFTFIIIALVTEISCLYILTKEGQMVWYKELDLPYWDS